jgi:multidrug efflux pump
MLGVGIEKPIEFFPAIDPKSVYINIDPPEGADLAYVDNIARQVEMAVSGRWEADGPPPALSDYARAYIPSPHEKADGENFEAPTDLNNIEHIYAKVVQGGSGFSFDSNLPNHIGIQFLDFEDRKTPTTRDIETIRHRVRHIAGAQVTVAQQEEGPPTGAPINIEISGGDFARLGALAEQSPRRHRKDAPCGGRARRLRGWPALGAGAHRSPEDRLVRHDHQPDRIGPEDGLQRAGCLYLLRGRRGLRHRGDPGGGRPPRHRRAPQIHDPDPRRKMVPLTTLATIDYSGSLGDIVRINHDRVVTVKANVDETKMPGRPGPDQGRSLLAGFPPAGRDTTIKFTGENEFQTGIGRFPEPAFVVAVLLIFLILVTLFNSMSQPLIILTSVALSLGGVFGALFVVMRSPFGIIMSGLGVFSLAGVVVNNAIVLIDYTNKLRERGMALVEAVVAAGATRLRPVLLTAITTILGLLPMVTGVSYDFHKLAISWASESTQWWRSMAIVVIFGLLVATLLTLVVVPTLYALVETSKTKMSGIFATLRAWYWKPFETRRGLPQEHSAALPGPADIEPRHSDRL